LEAGSKSTNGRDLASFHLPEDNPLAEVVIIVSASSARHAVSLADGLIEMCKKGNVRNPAYRRISGRTVGFGRPQ
jgi:ribosomal silencing factor RsfS